MDLKILNPKDCILLSLCCDPLYCAPDSNNCTINTHPTLFYICRHAHGFTFINGAVNVLGRLGHRPQTCCLKAQNANRRLPTFFEVFLSSAEHIEKGGMCLQTGPRKKALELQILNLLFIFFPPAIFPFIIFLDF